MTSESLHAAATPGDQTINHGVGDLASSQLAIKRRKLMLSVMAAALGAGAIWGVYAIFFGGRSVSTDDAYTNVEVADVTPLIAAPIKDVRVVNTKLVHVGDILVLLDNTDARIAVDRAKANLAQAQRKVRSTMAQGNNLAEQQQLREAEIDAAKADLLRVQAQFDKAEIDQRRRKDLIESGAVSRQELTDANAQFNEMKATAMQAQARIMVAKAALAASVGARQANDALVDDATVETNPEVLAAKAVVARAETDLERTVIRAPVSGVITERTADIGEQVQQGSRLMRIVPIDQVYVDANFKESQLQKVRVGQTVTATSDLYGSSVSYHGRVAGLSGGTGAAMSVIPAQNATGNWIKVVQRLPVRIRLDPAELEKHPLRIGLSMDVSVDLVSLGQARTSNKLASAPSASEHKVSE